MRLLFAYSKAAVAKPEANKKRGGKVDSLVLMETVLEEKKHLFKVRHT